MYVLPIVMCWGWAFIPTKVNTLRLGLSDPTDFPQQSGKLPLHGKWEGFSSFTLFYYFNLALRTSTLYFTSYALESPPKPSQG